MERVPQSLLTVHCKEAGTGMPKKLTIQDIARLAGVSKATVSRVLNHNLTVDPVLAERVKRVVQEQSFIPNVTATGLAGGRTRLIGVLAPPLTWPSVAAIMHGVAEYIGDTKYEVVLYSVSNERNHSDVLDHILSMKMVAGLLAILPGGLSQHLTTRVQEELPLVMIDDQGEPTTIPWVGVDNLTSAYRATRYLLELGHRRIAHIQGPQSYHCAVERYQGFSQAMLEAGITPDPTLLLQGTFETPGGRQCAHELFSREKSAWPTAIFAGNDEMAYGVLEVAEQQGIRVPEDVAVVGFDDNILSAHMRPPLTTIRQPFSAMGRMACEVLLSMIEPSHRLLATQPKDTERQDGYSENISIEQPIRIQLPTRLIVRASTAAPHSLTMSS
jgi:LacI family transcriptional regulator